MEVVVTAGAIRCAKLQSNCHHQQTNIHHFAGWMHFLSPNQQCQSTDGKSLTGRARKTAMKRCVCSDTCLCTRYRDNDGEAGCLCVRSADDGGKLATDELTDLYRQTDRQTDTQTDT